MLLLPSSNHDTGSLRLPVLARSGLQCVLLRLDDLLFVPAEAFWLLRCLEPTLSCRLAQQLYFNFLYVYIKLTPTEH